MIAEILSKGLTFRPRFSCRRRPCLDVVTIEKADLDRWPQPQPSRFSAGVEKNGP